MYSLVFHEAQTYFLLLRTSCAAISNMRSHIHEELHGVVGQIGYRILVLCANYIPDTVTMASLRSVNNFRARACRCAFNFIMKLWELCVTGSALLNHGLIKF